MHQGFGFNQQGRKFPEENLFNRQNEPSRNFGPNQDNFAYYLNSQYNEESNEGIPHNIKVLFDSDEKVNFENRGSRINQGNPPGMRPTDPRQQQQQLMPNQIPNQMNFNNVMNLQSFNALINQSGEFGRMSNQQKDLDTSNLSNRDSANQSLTNISRDSSRANLNNSKRNASSRANVKDKNYQLSINDDISLIERIEVSLNQITMNHNKTCPFCSKAIDIRKCNFQNISAFMSNTSRRYYLTHFDCYLKSNSNHSIQLLPLGGIIEARLNANINALTNIDTSNFIRSDRKAYFISIEGYHPISSFLLFKLDKLSYGLEHATYRNHLLYVNLANQSTSIFEPNTYAVPFSEFRVVITVHTSHANEDPYTFEFLVDYSQVKVTAEQKQKPVEVFYLHGENNIVMGTQVVFDANAELGNNLNYAGNLDSSFQSTGSQSSGKPNFGKNVFIVMKYFTVSLPLKRVEKRVKDLTGAALDEPMNAQQKALQNQQLQAQAQAQAQAQKKGYSKLQLNPNAPLFSKDNQGFEPQPQPQAFYPQGNPQLNAFPGAKPGMRPPGTNFGQFEMDNVQGNLGNIPGAIGPNAGNNNLRGIANIQQAQNQGNPLMGNSSNMFFNNQQFQQGFPQEQNLPGGHFNKLAQQQPNAQDFGFPPGFNAGYQSNPVKPPGLVGQQGGLGGNQNPNMPMMGQGFNNPQSLFPNANMNLSGSGIDSAGKKKSLQGLQVETRGSQPFKDNYSELVEKLSNPLIFNDIPMTPDRIAQGEEIEQMIERGRPKNMNPNLYTAVLSGIKRDSSNSKSPSLSKIQNKYFSGFSTPRSDNTFTPPQANTPLRRLTPTGSSHDLQIGGDDSDQQWTEDMIENFKLDAYIDNLVEFAKTYNGSRVLQKFFPRATQNEIDAVINKIQGHIEELMLDPYANYMFQTLAQSCSSEQRYLLLQQIAPSMVKIACDRKGTHSLQAIVSLINRGVEDKLIHDTLDGHVLQLTLDAQGTHLIQKLVVAISIGNIGFIYEPVISRFAEVANNSFGLCVLKQLMTKVEKDEQMRNTIVHLLYENLEDLIQNPYGNYAVQHAFDCYPGQCDKILDKILDKIIQYSDQKFSSNVIEKCLVLSTAEYKHRFVKEILKSDRIVELMKNKYGNFVILKVLATATSEDKVSVMQGLQRNVNAVNVTKYKNRWIQFIEENPMKIPGFNTSQTVKPSLFKHSTNSPRQSHDDNFGSDNDSTGWGEDWGDNKKKGHHHQQHQHQHQQKFQKEEKSQFFYKSNTSKPNGNNDFDDHFGFNTMQPSEQHGYGGHPQGGFTNSPGFRPGGQGHNFGGYNNNNPHNQRKNKPYNTNQQHQGQAQGHQGQGHQGQGQGQGQGNKWGYTNFF